MKINTPYPEDSIAYFKIWIFIIFWKLAKMVLLKKSPIRCFQLHGYACMTRSSTTKLFTPYKEPEREFRSSRRHFKTLSLDELRSPDFNLLSDEEYSEEKEEEIAETMEQYMSKIHNRLWIGSP
ncbi:hypothetical protein Tco_0259818 [Tanacetum coccineum]